MSMPRPGALSLGPLVAAMLLIGVDRAHSARPPLTVELRHLCDATAAGIRTLPRLERPFLVAVAPLEGEADRATRDVRRVLGDYIVACLFSTHGYEVGRAGMADGTGGPPLAGADVRVAGTVSRGPQCYTVSLTVTASEADRIASSIVHPLPIEETDRYVVSILAPRTPAAAALRSAALPGWGQFYNDQATKGVLFVSAEALLIGAAVGFYIASADADRAYHTDYPETVGRKNDEERYADWAGVALGLAAIVWVGAILDAWLDGYRYDPERAFDRRGRIGPVGQSETAGLRLRWTGTGIVGEW